MKRLILSFGYAGRGLWYCLRHERHFRIHLVVAAYVLAFAPAFSLSRGEWAVLLLMISLVITTEGINTAIERAVDLGAKGPHPLARVAKDAAAGAVLFCAAVAVVVGLVLFARPAALAALVADIFSSFWKLALLALSVPAALLFIFKGGVPAASRRKKPLKARERNR